MKSLFVSYANYNSWANNLLASAILSLTPEQQNAEVKSSFSSLHKTLLHMLDAENIWWQRMKLAERINRPSDQFSGDTQEVISFLHKQDKDWVEWTASASDAMLQHEFIYYNSKKEKFKQPVCQMLLHLFNHGSYHRGQLVTILRQLGVEKIPPTDYIVWARKYEKPSVKI
jgi:uncharacterized damage-inducible protein DinB